MTVAELIAKLEEYDPSNIVMAAEVSNSQDDFHDIVSTTQTVEGLVTVDFRPVSF